VFFYFIVIAENYKLWIMRDVNAGWALRYAHANIASFFFIFVYAHIGRGLYYSSYREPRGLVWTIGVIIFVLMMAIGFLGYVLPYGQMSLWGDVFCPTCNNNLLIAGLISSFPSFSVLPATIPNDKDPTSRPICGFTSTESLGQASDGRIQLRAPANAIKEDKEAFLLPFNSSKVRALKRIGPHNYDIVSIIFGSMLGDCYAEKHGEGTRFCFQQEGSHAAYLLWFHSYISKLGYCNKTVPQLGSRLALHGKLRKVLRFKTFTFSSFNWIEECFYIKDPDLNRRIKVLPSAIEKYLSPLALAIWIMDDGGKVSGGMKLSTHNFTKKEVLLLCDILINKFGLKATIQSAAPKGRVISVSSSGLRVREDQHIIYISKTSMVKLSEIVGPYIHPSMKYKLNGYL